MEVSFGLLAFRNRSFASAYIFARLVRPTSSGYGSTSIKRDLGLATEMWENEPATLLPYLSLLGIVIGWFVANHQANRREDRKEARSLVDQVKSRANLIAEQSLQYQCEDKSELAVLIKSSIDALEIDLSRMPNFAVKNAPLITALIDFQDAVTGGDFETAGRIKRSAASDEIATVLRTRNRLLSEIERQFRAYYL